MNKRLADLIVKWRYEVVYIRKGRLAVKVFNYCEEYPKDWNPLELPEDVSKFTKTLTNRKVSWYAYLFKNPSGNYCSHAYVEKEKVASKFKWRNHLDEVNKILDYWNKIAMQNVGWSRPKGCLWVEGAIYSLTGKEVTIDCMVDICQALDIPYCKREDGMVAWGDAVKDGELKASLS